jgi:hypothetical protein
MFLIIKISPLLLNIANIIFEVEMQNLSAKSTKNSFKLVKK